MEWATNEGTVERVERRARRRTANTVRLYVCKHCGWHGEPDEIMDHLVLEEGRAVEVAMLMVLEQQHALFN